MSADTLPPPATPPPPATLPPPDGGPSPDAAPSPPRAVAPKLLVALTHHRWALPVLAHMDRSGGARVAELHGGLGVSRGSARTTMAWLVSLGLAERTEGYGHSLRPEYVLTAAGAHLGPTARRLVDALERETALEACLRKWALPVLFAVGEGCDRFSAIERAVPGVTPRALALVTRQLAAAGLLDREIEAAYPPRPLYRQPGPPRLWSVPLAELGHLAAGPPAALPPAA